MPSPWFFTDPLPQPIHSPLDPGRRAIQYLSGVYLIHSGRLQGLFDVADHRRCSAPRQSPTTLQLMTAPLSLAAPPLSLMFLDPISTLYQHNNEDGLSRCRHSSSRSSPNPARKEIPTLAPFLSRASSTLPPHLGLLRASLRYRRTHAYLIHPRITRQQQLQPLRVVINRIFLHKPNTHITILSMFIFSLIVSAVT